VGAYQKELQPLLNRNTEQKKSVGKMMQMHAQFFSAVLFLKQQMHTSRAFCVISTAQC
jgi:hypothetical protein